MKITIETEDGKSSVDMDQGGAVTQGETPETTAPPPEVAARAAAVGALSAGPAPSEARSEGPAVFIPQPGTPATTIEGQGGAPIDLAAGAAPDLASNVEEEEIFEDESAEGEPEE